MNLGFIGLGEMAEGIIPRLMDAGHKVAGWNRTPGKGQTLVDAGMAMGDSPADVASKSEAVFSCVTNLAAVEAVALGEQGILSALSEGRIYMDMSTISPFISRKVAVAFAEKNRIMLDTPISGSPVSLEQGKASIMVSGDKTAFEQVREVLGAVEVIITGFIVPPVFVSGPCSVEYTLAPFDSIGVRFV